MKPVIRAITVGVIALACVLGASRAPAQPIGQWDFNSGNLSGTVGQALEYLDPITEAATTFNTTAGFGLPPINGTVANVMRFPANTAPQGYRMLVETLPSGGGSLVNQWTLIFDVLYPAESATAWRPFIETDGRSFWPDAEFYVNPSGGIGINGVYDGSVLANTWYRIGFVVDTPNNIIRKYINGTLVGSQPATEGATPALDGRWALDPSFLGAELFTDNDGEAAVGYVNSIQLRDVPLSTPQMQAIGGPSAAGIPQVVPPIPSFVQSWIPVGAQANRTTDFGATIFKGDSTVSAIILRLDGQVLSSPQITDQGETILVFRASSGLLPASSDHVLEVSYLDSQTGGRKTNSHAFRAVILYEDFEGLTLMSGVDRAVGSNIWTKTGPEGWTIDDSGVPGAGDPGTDGTTEFAGWSFMSRDWWGGAVGQDRQNFIKSTGIMAVADPDEWDDIGHTLGLFNTLMKTAVIPLSGVGANTAFLKFDSAWRAEGCDDNASLPNNQTATITVSYSGGADNEVLRWDSSGYADCTPPPTIYYHADNVNETVIIPLNNPAGATSMQITFGLLLAENDWFWAVDNIVVDAGAVPPSIIQQPVNVEVLEGQPASFSVTAGGGEPLFYQWYKGQGATKVLIPGATAATYSILQTTAADAGLYSCQVSNSSGTVFSAEASLTIQLKLGSALLLCETFDELPLGSSVDETPFTEGVWTKTAPDGWVIDDSGVPGAGDPGQDGVTEWAGWSFAKRDWWAQVGGQSRAGFVKGAGAVAIADSDEWDDIGHAAGNMATYLSVRPVSLQGVRGNSVVLQFDSSWRPEPSQKANVTVSFDGGAPIEVLRWESVVGGPNFHPDALSETVSLQINNPEGASSMVVKFGYFDTRNNWWWAIDNVLVTGERMPFFRETFDGIALGPNVEEGIITGSGGAQANVWSKAGPAGWTTDDTGVPGAGTTDDGVTEWAGWSFASRTWWASTAGGQQREQFTKGTGTTAIADSDEWDDIAHAAGNMATYLSTPAISLAGLDPNSLSLRFDSSWRAEEPQKVNITASFDGGPPTEILRWESDPASPYFHNDNVNETVTVNINNPSGANSIVLKFGYFDTRNNWWWAIDNVELTSAASRFYGPLQIQHNGVEVQLSWPGSDCVKLQSSPTMAPGSWTDVPGTDGASSATVTAGVGHEFFRLVFIR